MPATSAAAESPSSPSLLSALNNQPNAPKPLPRPEVRSTFSALQKQRLATPAKIPAVLKAKNVQAVTKEALGAVADHEQIEGLFPTTYGKPRIELTAGPEGSGAAGPGKALRVGVVLSGGQASGGHNVIAGVYDYIKSQNPASVLLGFANGPKGVYTGKYYVIDDSFMDAYRNTGGFDALGSGRDKIESPEEFAGAKKVCESLALDGLVVIGGDDSNTNAAVLAEYFAVNDCPTRVIGAPKTIDGDLKNEYIPVSFGFDTACKTYSELIGNVMLDCLSSQKYYHFVRLMGRSASHIALECALQTRPNATLISEEVEAKHLSLSQVTHSLVSMIVERAKQGKHYGVILLPEGIIEFIPEFQALMHELNDLMAAGVANNEEAVMQELSFNNRAVFSYLPANIKEQLLLDRDPHGNVQVAKIETEKLLAGTIEQELEKIRHHGEYAGVFQPQFHSFGYEGRAGLPSEFDSNYCYSLGLTAGNLIGKGLTSLMVSITGICGPVEQWNCGGVPLTMMMNMEKRHGKLKPVIRKALVELEGKPLEVLMKRRDKWAVDDCYRAPGPIQFDGPCSHEVNLTLQYECLSESEVQDPPDVPRPMTKMGAYMFSPTPRACLSSVQVHRLGYQNRVPHALKDRTTVDVRVVEGEATQCVFAKDRGLMRREFPRSYGLPMVHLHGASGEPAPMSASKKKLQQLQEGHTKSKPSFLRNNTLPIAEEEDEQNPFVFSDLKSELCIGEVDGVNHLLKRHGSLSSKQTLATHQATAEKPITVGVVFCGRQTPGGHNVVAGLYDYLAASNSTLLGFVGGIDGLYKRQIVEVTSELLSTYRNQGGLDMLGRSHESFPDTPAKMEGFKDACVALKLDGLVFVGGCRTATGVAYLTEYLKAESVPTACTVVPAGIDGTLTNQFVESTVGFHTACQVYSELVGNTAIDGASAKKYWMFLRLMGSDVSNIALEVALRSAPNLILLAEDVDASRMSLQEVVREVADLVTARASRGRNYGTVLIPEGLVLSIPEIAVLLHEIDGVFRESEHDHLTVEAVAKQLTSWSAALLLSMPLYIQVQMTKERQSNNCVQLSAIETERLLCHFVEVELSRRKTLGQYKGSFSPVCSFLGYQARGSLPSNFDCNLGYSLGGTAAVLVHNKLSGYLATITGLKGKEEEEWKVAGVPLTAMLALEDREHHHLAYNGQLRPRVPAKKVDLHGAAYKFLVEKRREWGMHDMYENSGPLQFDGSTADDRPATVVEEDRDYLEELEVLHAALHQVRRACRPGCSSALLHLATKSILTLTDVVSMMDEAASV